MIILASQSPRRRELLKFITTDFVVKTAAVDESLPHGIAPADAVSYLSKIKALPFKNDSDIVIGADTVVAIDNKILGKPADDNDARRMLNMLSGREHNVYTGVTILKGDYCNAFVENTSVKFNNLSTNDIENYIATGEHRDKAGSYGIQGYGSLLVQGITGDYFNVVGLPVSRLNAELKKLLNNYK